MLFEQNIIRASDEIYDSCIIVQEGHSAKNFIC